MCLYCGMTKQKLQMHIGFNLLSVTFKNSVKGRDPVFA